MTDLKKQKFTLFFSNVESYTSTSKEGGLISQYNLNGIHELLGFITADATIGDVVYLGVVFDEVFVSCDILAIIVPIKAMLESLVEVHELVDDIKVHFFECTSYEDAYKTALSMQEEKELCYDKK